MFMKKGFVLGIGLLASLNAMADGKAGTCACQQNTALMEAPGYYILGTIGQSIPAAKLKNTLNTAFAKSSVIAGVGVGYDFGKRISADVTVNHRFKYWYDHNAYENKFSSTSVMFTGYYSFPTNTVSPYLAAGAGVSFNKLGDVNYLGLARKIDDEDSTKGNRHTSFAWHVGTGIKFKVFERGMLDLGYRFTNLGRFKSSNTNLKGDTDRHDENSALIPVAVISNKLKAHEIVLSLIYKL
jgi:opacity protein-like surface antigen